MNDETKNEVIGLDNSDNNKMNENFNNETYPGYKKIDENSIVNIAKGVNIITYIYKIIIASILLIFCVFYFIPQTIPTNIENFNKFIYKDNKVKATMTNVNLDKGTYVLTYVFNGKEITEETKFINSSVTLGEGNKFYLYLNDNGDIKYAYSNDAFDYSTLMYLIFSILMSLASIYVIIFCAIGLKNLNTVYLKNERNVKISKK